MESFITGEVSCDGISDSKGFHRFIEKRIERWILSNSELAGQSSVTFDVTFSREGAGHLVNCQLRINGATRSWFASSYGDGPQHALTQALENTIERSLSLRAPAPIFSIQNFLESRNRPKPA